MTPICQSFSFVHVPPVFKRGSQVMLGIFDKEDRLYLSRKHAYPPDVYRLFGGGVEANETIDQAAKRELKEETSLELPLTHQQTFVFNFTETSTQSKYQYQADLFYCHIQTQQIIPGDDVDLMRIFLPEDLTELLTVYNDLPQTIVSPDKQNQFSWYDYGQAFGVIHRYVLDHWPQI